MASEPLDNIDQQFAQLKSELANLQRKYDEIQPENLKSEFATLQSAHRSLVRKVRASGAGVLILSCICLLSNSLPTALAQGYGTTLRSILQRISALETAQKTTTAIITRLNSNVATLNTKTKYLTTGIDRNGYPASYFTACNVYIQDGLGSTSGIPTDPILSNLILDSINPPSPPRTNGLGNLIIGYNEADPNNTAQIVTGSHNLILGGGNSYDSFGGIIDGIDNQISEPYDTIISGYLNQTDALLSVVLDGNSNFVSGQNSTISGGTNNIADGFDSCVSGGAFNVANGEVGVVSGGFSNAALGTDSTVSGGNSLLLVGQYGWAGGNYHTP